MNYAVGDRVRVKDGLRGGKSYNHLHFNYRMEKYCGKSSVVSAIYEEDETYKLEDFDEWEWNDEMLEPIDTVINIPNIPQYSMSEIMDWFGL